MAVSHEIPLQSVRLVAGEFIRVDFVAEWGYGSTCGGSQAGAHQTRAQTDPQPEVMNGGQPRVVAQERVQEQVVLCHLFLCLRLVIRLLNVLEALVHNNGVLPVPQTTSQTQTQLQLNVAATQAP
ncbi:hypothetical protein HAX54_053007 [Datura stramonium]|uniref:Uncharacterized protein n=1 Tax=Datura stramonium TaxID=4076 RepID=A0ABS8WS16_DATST|nr:hypothetical protein [Datura stramonium]